MHVLVWTNFNLQMTDTVATPEIAFIGDTMSDFILDPDDDDVLKAKIFVMEIWFTVSYHHLAATFTIRK